MRLAVCAVAGAYALLSAFAAAVQWKQGARRDTPAAMLCGGAMLLTAAILRASGWAYGWALGLLGGILIAGAALVNGRRGELHVGHHIVRAALTAALALGLGLL